MTRKFFSFCAYISACAAVGVALIVAGVSYVARDLPYYARLALATYEQAGGLRILFDDIDWSVTSGAGVRIRNLIISDPREPVPLFTSKSLTVRVSLASLLKRRFTVSKIILQDPEITLVKKVDGGFYVPEFPVPFSAPPAHTQLFDFSLALNKLIIENASVHVVGLTSNTALHFEGMSCSVSWDRKKARYVVSGTCSSFRQGSPYSLLFSGSFWFAGRQKSLKTLTGDVSIEFSDIPLYPFLSFFDEIPNKFSVNGSLSGKVALALSPDHSVNMTGTVSSRNLAFSSVSAGMLFSSGPFSTTMQISSDSLGQGDSTLMIRIGVLPPITIFATSRRLDKIRNIYISLQARPFRCSIADLKKLASTLLPNKGRWQLYANRMIQGNLAVDSLQASVVVQDNGTLIFPAYGGSISLNNMSIMITKNLPPLVVHSGKAHFSNTIFSGSLQASIFDNDTHDVTFTTYGDNSTAVVDIESSLPSHESNMLLGCFIPSNLKAIVSLSGGKATVRTHVFLDTRRNSSFLDIHGDLSNPAIHFSSLTKQENTPASFTFSGTLPLDNETSSSFSFNIDFDNASSISAVLRTGPPLFIVGSYRISWLNVAEFTGNTLPAGLILSGFVNGSGLFAFPMQSRSGIPFLGSISLDHLSVIHEYSGQKLIGADGYFLISPERVSTLNGYVQIGVTNGSLSGCLSTIDPPNGFLRIHARLFDIDDFLGTIGTVQSCIGSSSAPFRSTDQSLNSPFLRTNLVMHFTVDRLHVMNWDFTDGVSRYTFRNGVMRWDDITICAGGGTINGFVEYNFSNPLLRSLTLAPSRSNVDFVWAVPGTQKKKTITGTLDLKGEFTSRFSRKQDLGINMRGSFTATVRNGVIQKFNVISKILSLMNVAQLAQLKTPDIFEKGMPFDIMTGNFTLETGVMKTDNLVIRSPAMNLSAVGDIDLRTDTVDFILGAQVLSSISHVIGTIPFAGEMVTGKDKSLTISYFHVKGPYDEASVTPMPVKSLSGPVLRIFKKLLDIPRELFSPIADNSTTQ